MDRIKSQPLVRIDATPIIVLLGVEVLTELLEELLVYQPEEVQLIGEIIQNNGTLRVRNRSAEFRDCVQVPINSVKLLKSEPYFISCLD